MAILNSRNLSPKSFRFALILAQRATYFERSGKHEEADRLADQVRTICSQTLLRNVGEFAGYSLRGIANGVAAVGTAVGHGVQEFGGGVAGGWTGKFAPLSRGPRVKMQDRPDTAHLPSPEAVAWAQSQGTTLDQFISRCEAWVEQNGHDRLLPHLKQNGVPSDVVKYVNRMVD